MLESSVLNGKAVSPLVGLMKHCGNKYKKKCKSQGMGRCTAKEANKQKMSSGRSVRSEPMKSLQRQLST